MNFMTPSFFILSIFLVAVLLFYLFRKQYESQVIPSTLLWQQVMNEWQATKWWRKLQHHLLLYLQLIILFLLMLALVRPYIGLNELSGEHIVLILDTSASMTTEESENTTRLELAKEQAIELVDKLDNQLLTVILAEETPTILFSNEPVNQETITEIEQVQPSFQHANMKKTIPLAIQILSGTTGEIHVFSDAVKKEQIDQTLLTNKLVVHNIGTSNDNIALHTFGVVQNNEGISGIVTVYNESDEERLVTISIENENDILYTLEELIEPRKLVQLPISNLPSHTYYNARLTTPDDYKADNHLVAFLGQNTTPSIHLIGDINPFTTKALSYFSEDIVQYDKNTTVTQSNAVYVLEGVPEKEWPDGPSIIFEPELNGAFQVKEKKTLTEAVEKLKDDPLFQYVDMSEVYIQSSFPYVQSELETLLTSGDTPLISKGYYKGHPIVFIGFDIADTDWPLHASFPIFLYNAITFLYETQDTLGYLKPMQQFTFAHPIGTTKSTIVNEHGDEILSLSLDEADFKAPSSPGLYRIISENNEVLSEKLFAVTIDPQEKYIQPKTSFTLEVEDSKNSSQERPNEIWPWIALFALLILFIEWEVYRRGISNR
ncbi:BatA domain-containing protein [Ornithinibacillus halotolerans]|uniref:VWA domain-containing protein n=1 Tax=Ornithinibacillus halotolerans TaxID=1274357 RepID=A0A916RMK7_9BACI|nr:BatA domain-containing protein [Ornithinibacillus halotolerans]GGA61961.1 hypothetical protein GCM10008025_02390 [Ornithinibacillus halotolerans]